MNKKGFIWLIPILVTALAMSGCGGDDDDGGAANLNFSGQQVYEMDAGGNLIPYTGANQPFLSNVGISGSITSGKMSFGIGKPSALLSMQSVLTDPGSKLDGGLDILSYSSWIPTETQATVLEFFSIRLFKTNYNNASIASITKDLVFYIYVDRACTITAAGKPGNYEGVPVVISNLNLNLKQGWNAVKRNITGSTASITTVDLSSGNWVLLPIL
jgi:hypothetical protein